jgi:two-component system cell cycle sensor histidine kinase/response regulator CckA
MATEVGRLRDRLRVLSEVTQSFVAATTDYPSLLEVVVRRTSEVLGCFCGVSLTNDEGEFLDLVATHDANPEVLKRIGGAWKPGTVKVTAENATTMVLRTNQQLVLSDPDPEVIISKMRAELQPIARSIGVRTMILSPVRSHGTAIGVLSVVRHGPDAEPLDELDADLAQCLAENAGMAIANARLFADAQREIADRRRAESQLRRTEEQLRHAQKMDAIGRLAGSIAHDFNNVLSVILSYTSLLLADLKAIDPMRNDIEQIKLAAERAADLTRQLLAFSRQQVMEPKIVDLNVIVKGMDRMLKRLLGEDIEMAFKPKQSLRLVKVDPGQIEQVIMNLVINAKDAMPGGGQLTIETADVDLDESYVFQHLGSLKGSHAVLIVSDTGVGMDQAVQPRIFEPFFTTKPKGKGTGLGLSTVFGIVQQSGGNVWVYSEPGKGTTFKVYLPEAKGDLVSRVPAAAPVKLEGNETILLAEDADQVRGIAHTILERYGYSVLVAKNAGEALLACENHKGKIHLLLTDVVMPQMSGHQLAERLGAARPEMKVLYMSGYTEKSVVQHGILDSGIDYLQKPFTPEMLARRVREILDAPKRPV